MALVPPPHAGAADRPVVERSVTAGDLTRNFGHWQNLALTAPVIITRHGRPRVALISVDRLKAEAAEPAGTGPVGWARLMAHGWDAAFLLGQDLRVREANDAGAELVDDLGKGSGVVDLPAMFGPAQSVVREQLRRVLRTGEMSDLEVRDVGGPARCYSLRAVPCGDDVGLLVRDRSAEFDMERRLQDGVAVGRGIDALPGMGLAQLDARGVVIGLSDGLRRLSGYSAADLATARFTDIVRPRDRAGLDQAFEAALQIRSPRHFTTALLTLDGGDLPVELGVSPRMRRGVADGLAVVVRARTEG